MGNILFFVLIYQSNFLTVFTSDHYERVPPVLPGFVVLRGYYCLCVVLRGYYPLQRSIRVQNQALTVPLRHTHVKFNSSKHRLGFQIALTSSIEDDDNMEEESASINLLKVDIHYNGFFTPKPLTYLGGVRVSVRDVDFSLFFLREFKEFLGNLCKTRCDDVYYCTKHETLAEGIRRFGNDADYVEFLEVGYEDENEFRMNVYIDHENEPVLDWADMEVPDEEVEDMGKQIIFCI